MENIMVLYLSRAIRLMSYRTALKINYYISYYEYFISSRNDKTIYLFGEKSGTEAKDNAFHMFCYLYGKGYKNAYYVIHRRSIDLKHLSPYFDQVVYRNSLKHFRLLFRARLLLHSDGFSDTLPTISGIFSATDTSIFYLRHGIMRYKAIYFNAHHFGGRIVRFTTSLTSETYIAEKMMMARSTRKVCSDLDLLRQLMGLPESCYSKDGIGDFISAINTSELTPNAAQNANRLAKQASSAIQSIGFPRSRIAQTGLARHDVLLAPEDAENQKRTTIFIFLTWRDHWVGRNSTAYQREMYRLNEDVFANTDVQSFAKKNNLSIRVFLHHKIRKFADAFMAKKIPNVTILTGDVDFQKEMKNAKILITDYSSVAFDFLIGGSAIVFYQPDSRHFANTRGDFVSEERGWIGPVAYHSRELGDAFRCAIERRTDDRDLLLAEYPTFGNAREKIENEICNVPPKVTFLCYNVYGIGGTVMSVVNSANYLFSKGYPVEIVCLRRTEKTPKLSLHPSIPIRSFFESGFKGRRSEKHRILSRCRSFLMNRNDDLFHRVSALMDMRLIAYLRTTKSDVLIATTPSLASSTIRFSRKSAVVIVQEHKFFEAHHPAIQQRIKKYYQRAHAIACLTHQDADEYSRITGRSSYIVPNGTLQPGEAKVTNNIHRVIALGRLTSQKQFDLLIKAFSIARSEDDGWQLHIFGDGPEAGRLQEQIEDLELTEVVILCGSTSNAIEEIGGSEILAVSSTYEGFGMTFIEGYACGIPVITFDIDRGPKEIVVDNVTGLKVIPFSVDDYAEKLARLMHDDDLRRSMGEAGNKIYRKSYTIDIAGQALESLIAKALEQHHREIGAVPF